MSPDVRLPPAQARAALRAVHVVVPAHDEEQHVGACLRSVARAAEVLRAARPELVVRTTLVLDRCTDGTARVAAELGVDTLAVDAGSVGAARAAGVWQVCDQLRALDPRLDPRTVLVVNTDADCTVPATWLVEHVALAAAHDLVQGEVCPEPAEMTPVALAAWQLRNPAGRGSLHGANLGFRLDAYLLAGGFPEVAEHEDLLLVRAMKARGVAATGGTRVVTSGRRQGRVEGGFAAYLRHLDLELADPSSPVHPA